MLTIRRVKVDSLHVDPDNSRTHGDANMAAIIASLSEFGQVEPLVVQRVTRRVIGGNGRLEAMRRMGWDECSIVEVDLDGTRAAALAVALNRSAELASWDFETLAETLEAVRADDSLPIEATGFTDAQVDDLLESLAKDAAGEPEGDGEPESPLAGRYEVVVKCSGEADQRELFERLTAEGRTCQILTL